MFICSVGMTNVQISRDLEEIKKEPLGHNASSRDGLKAISHVSIAMITAPNSPCENSLSPNNPAISEANKNIHMLSEHNTLQFDDVEEINQNLKILLSYSNLDLF